MKALLLLKSLITYLFIVVSALWVCLFVYYHRPFDTVLDFGVIGAWLLGALYVLITYQRYADVSLWILLAYGVVLAIPIWLFASSKASASRDWHDEVAHIVDFEQAGDTVTVRHVRNFDWHSEDDYQVHWETRRYDLSSLRSLDLVASYWMGEPIAHTFLSFGFDDGRHLAFSIEIRKERGERFSTLGGFFRQYEIAVIASDEKDIIYTRSNVRGEDVYIYPLTYDKPKIQALFLAYLHNGRQLNQYPRWYNSLTRNCTTTIFEMIDHIDKVPRDYRLILSGYLPSYLHDHKIISPHLSLNEWRRRAHINPKSAPYSSAHPIDSTSFSQLIRQDFD